MGHRYYYYEFLFCLWHLHPTPPSLSLFAVHMEYEISYGHATSLDVHLEDTYLLLASCLDVIPPSFILMPLLSSTSKEKAQAEMTNYSIMNVTIRYLLHHGQ